MRSEEAGIRQNINEHAPAPSDGTNPLFDRHDPSPHRVPPDLRSNDCVHIIRDKMCTQGRSKGRVRVYLNRGAHQIDGDSFSMIKPDMLFNDSIWDVFYRFSREANVPFQLTKIKWRGKIDLVTDPLREGRNEFV